MNIQQGTYGTHLAVKGSIDLIQEIGSAEDQVGHLAFVGTQGEEGLMHIFQKSASDAIDCIQMC